MARLEGLRVAVLATDGFEESELTEPVKALRNEGAKIEIIAPEVKKLQAFRHMDKGTTVQADHKLADVNPDDYDALLLPGGALNADFMRVVPEVKRFVQSFDRAGKPMAVICHAPWLLVSAGCVRGRTLTSYHTIQDDIRNAGGNWVDREMVEDRNLVTSRQPKDLPAFIKAMTALFERSRTAAAAHH
ncbi:MAG TPA: type 1 glutamine amidotransferase domain-containing protein [Gemmataceae bacterium]|jgi:protease I|nr:type 1 glutamine amidotransferase domain-containing protein [Gemmataceae bacterium]